MIRLRPLGRALILLSLAAVAGCQTAGQRNRQTGPTPVVFAQSQGWLIERYVATGPGLFPYCVASRPTGGPDLAFMATPTNTGMVVSGIGRPLASEATYEVSVVFDGGGPRTLRSKPMGSTMLAAPLGGTEVGTVLTRFASSGSVTLGVPNIGLRKRFDLDGSTWAINKLSECMHGTPARYKAPAKPTDKAGEKQRSATKRTNDAVPPNAAQPSVQAKNQPPSGGVDLDEAQPVDLDAIIPNG